MVQQPQSIQFWAPPTPQLDASPLIRGAEVSASAMVAAGQAIGQGIKEGRARADEQEKIKKREAAADEISKIMDEVSSDKNYDTVNIEPWLADPTLAGMSRDQAVPWIAASLEARGIPRDIAYERAKAATSPVSKRVYKPGFEAAMRSKIARAQVLASQAGIDPNSVNTAISISMQDVYPNAGAADAAAAQNYMNILAPQSEIAPYIEAKLRGDAEREKQVWLEDQADREYRQYYEKAADAWQREQVRMDLDQKYKIALQNNDADKQKELARVKWASERDLNNQKALLEEHTRLLLGAQEAQSAREIAQIKAGGTSLGDSEAKALSEFTSIQEYAFAYDTWTEAPITSIPGILGEASLDTMVGPQKPGQESIFLFGESGVKKANDYRGVLAYIDEGGEVKLRDTRGAFSQEQLDRASKLLFSNEKAKFAVAMQMVYGGSKASKDDLDKLYATNQLGRALGGDGVLDRTVKLLAKSRADRAKSGFISTQDAQGKPQDAKNSLFGGGK